MLSTSKLMEIATVYSDQKSVIKINNKNEQQIYKNGFYDGYLFSEKMKVEKKRKPKVQTLTGKLANVGIGRKTYEKKTSAEWQKQCDDVVVLDPDGWDRSNFKYSWHEEKITLEEYLRRRNRSTVKWNNKKRE